MQKTTKNKSKTIEFQTKKGKFLAIKPTKHVSYLDNDQFLICLDKLTWMDTTVEIPEKGFGFSFLLSKVTESECNKVVENIFGKSYKNYFNPNPENNYAPTFDFDTALESFKSLMDSIGIYTVNPFKKPNLNDYNDDFGNYEHDLEQWKAAQKRTATEWLIFKIK